MEAQNVENLKSIRGNEGSDYNEVNDRRAEESSIEFKKRNDGQLKPDRMKQRVNKS